MIADRFLQGRVAWVTGGATGMGLQIALELAAAGADVAIGSLLPSQSPSRNPSQNVYTPSEQELEAARDSLAARGVRTLARSLDVRSDDSVRDFFGAVMDVFGPVEILVNAAGTGARHSLIDHPDDLWDDVIATNLTGAYRTSKLCLPGMIARKWGRIVNLASTAASTGSPYSAAYCSSKAGLLGLTRCVALEGAPHGVTCNAISPGSVATPSSNLALAHLGQMLGQGKSVGEMRQEFAQANPQKRLIQPEEVAALALFLCRDEALGITMQDIVVSGGARW
jgi:NAD(P)-dependent dehydrogenase (short-subunit alcohol dehydrogenase family)